VRLAAQFPHRRQRQRLLGNGVRFPVDLWHSRRQETHLFVSASV
jgi:hypothetical protein